MSSRKNKKPLKKKHKQMKYNRKEELTKLYPAMINTRYGRVFGYINYKGEFIIEPKYERAGNFNEFGLAIVEEKNLVGLINTKGEYIVKPIYESISPYKEGRAIYVLNEKMGVMDEEGNSITKKSYDFIMDYSGDRAVVGINNPNGSYNYGYIDRYGNEVIIPKFLQADDFKDDVALVKIKDKEYGLIDKNGNIINTYKYDYVGQYGNGLMVFANSSGGPFGYINREGKEVIKPIYTMAQGFKDGIAVVSEDEGYNGPYGGINVNGQYVVQSIYSEIKSLGQGKFALGMPIGKEKISTSSIYAIADNNGKRLTDFNYLVVGDYKNGLSYASDTLNTFFINESGKIEKTLPVVSGSGELRVKNNIVFADIDFSPYYLTKSGRIIYKPNSTIELNDKYSVTRVKYRPNINYLVYNPEINGILSEKVRQDVNVKLKVMSRVNPSFEEKKSEPLVITPDDVLDFNYYGDFSIKFFKKNLLVLDMTGYYYPFGAAHGMPSRKTPNIDLVTGKFYALGDLFMGGVYWTGELNKIIENMIKTDPQYNEIYQDGFKGITMDQSFYVDENNLYIYFSPYDIAPYAAGFVTFKIPFTEIQGMINKRGDFYKAFN